METYCITHRSYPYVSLQYVVRSGAACDGDTPGLVSMISDVLSSGAGGRDAERLAEDIDVLGADFDTSVYRDFTVLRFGVLSQYVENAIELLADIVRRPHFSEGELAREKRRKIATLKQNYADPSYLASVLLRREIHRGTPYGTDIDGDSESIERIGSERCRGFHREHFTRGNSFLIGAGDIRSNELEALVERYFGGWEGERVHPMEFASPESNGSKRVHNHPGATHSAIRIGKLGIRRADDAYVPMYVLNILFGDYFNCRINAVLREQLGYTYGAWSYLDAPQRAGTFMVGTSVAAENTAQTIDVIADELRRLTTEPIEQQELLMVKNYITGHRALQSETPDQLAGMRRTIALHGLPENYYDDVVDQVQGLTSESLMETASSHLNPDDMSVIVVGDKEKVPLG